MFDKPTQSDARRLIESQGLRFEPDFDDLVGVHEDGQLVACGARAGYVLKMLAIAKSHQGTDVLGALVTKLLLSGMAAGYETVFVFTLPTNATSFQALNFRLLVTHGKAALLEHGPGLPAYLASHARSVRDGKNGAVVINGNPFTLGHLYLVEVAARQVDHLYVFVVREDRSIFPFAMRYALVTAATAHLPNVTVLDTSYYAVSAGTFPSYFLKRHDDVASAEMHLDLSLFAERIAPPFRIVTRLVGHEPLCPVTAAYNQAMTQVLEANGIRRVEIPRLEEGGAPISATRVRSAFAEGDFATLKRLVPPPTLELLQSSAAQPIAVCLRSRHKETSHANTA